MNHLSKDEFLKLALKGNLVPVYKEILGDLLTPVAAYDRLARHQKYAFLLESVEGEEKFARYSFIAHKPLKVIKTKGQTLEILTFKNGKYISEKKKFEGSPLNILRQMVKEYKAVELPQLPRFYGGFVGFMSYDCVRFFERLPDTNKDDANLPDMVFVQANELVIFDHRHHTIKIVSCAHVDSSTSAAVQTKIYNQSIKTIDGIIADLDKAPASAPVRIHKSKKPLNLRSNCTLERFKQMVKTAKKHITAGDIIQVVLSQRFEVPISVPAFNIYRALRALNPSPYMFYLHLDGIQLVGASPELLVRCEHGLVQTRPIAGTRPRGKDDAEDAKLQQELLADPKEKAEHIMLVDLGRNDLGRVCKQGTVKMTEFMGIEKYSHVMHIVSDVEGQLQPGKDALDVLQASFPAGTVSGAPKIRAMEIIEDLEPQKRGSYAGGVGYVSYSKNLDMCITIRTIIVRENKAYVQAGAGIVADSDPVKEYQETVNKAKAQIKAIEFAHDG